MFKTGYFRAKEADSAVSLAGWGYRVLDIMFPTAVTGLTMWAVSYRDWIWSDYGWLGAIIISVSVGVLASLALYLSGLGMSVWRRMRAGGESGTVTSSGIEFYPNRGSLNRAYGTLGDRLDDIATASGIFVVGQKFFHAQKNTGKMKQVLLPNPTGAAIKYLAQTAGSNDTPGQIRSATEHARAVGAKVKWYDHCVFNAIILADVDKPSGWIHIETVLPFSQAEERPSYTLYKKDSERAVQEIQRVFQEMWDAAKDPPKDLR